MNIKQNILEICQNMLNERMSRVQNTIKDIETSLNSESKSTAGDKHETGRAMLQLEREKVGNQLKELEKQQLILSRIQPESKSDRIALGSFVVTDKTNYFIATSIGEITTEDQMLYVISLQSPIGQLLIGKSIGDTIKFRGGNFKIIKIL